MCPADNETNGVKIMSTNDKTKQRPSHELFVVQDNNGKARWIKIGAAWLNKDKKGANLTFECMPLTGKVVMREVTEGQAETASDGAENGGQQ